VTQEPTPSRIFCLGSLTVLPVRGVGEVVPGDDLPALIGRSLRDCGVALQPWDVVVVTQKVVSKAEGALVDLATVAPSERALDLARVVGLEPAVVEVVLGQSAEVVLAEPGVLLCATHHGYVTANAGVDHSNVGAGTVSVLPRDPDGSATRLREAWLPAVSGGELGVVICDSFGRPFRVGTVNIAVGVAGMPAVSDYRSARDTHGEVLVSTVLASVDEVCAAADLVMGKLEGIPVGVVRGLRWQGTETGVAPLLRPRGRDVFRRGQRW